VYVTVSKEWWRSKHDWIISWNSCVLIKQNVSACSEAIIRLTNVSYKETNIQCVAMWIDVEISSSKAYITLWETYAHIEVLVVW
jgi:hypothetical protein